MPLLPLLSKHHVMKTIKDGEIEWTTGTDRPAHKVIAEQWQKKLGKKPDEKALEKLKMQIDRWRLKADETATLIKHEMERQTSSDDALLEFQLAVKMYRSVADELEKLLEKKTSSRIDSDDKPKNEFRKGLEKKAKDNDPYREKIIEAANHIIFNIEKTEPESMFGKGGYPIKRLWDHPHIRTLKFPTPPASTRKKWLREAKEVGEITSPVTGELPDS